MRRIVTHREQQEMRRPWLLASEIDDGGADVTCDPTDPTCRTDSQAAPEKAVNAPAVRSDATNSGNVGTGHAPAGTGGGGFSDSSGGAASGGVGNSVSGPAVPYTPSKGVQQWQTQVEQGLTRNGLPLTLAPQVMKQMESESSGNPNAINNWDSNAKAGHPSQGLMQTIPSTFQQYHLPGDSMNINDPQANVDSAIGYAKSRYGPTLMNEQGNGMGSGHGY